MRIKKIKLENFKRFTDLTIDEIPKEAKLVVLVGPNGCGKSSLFDAMLRWYTERVLRRGLLSSDNLYYLKRADPIAAYDIHGNYQGIEIKFWNYEYDEYRGPRMYCIYHRTAYRNTPELSVKEFRNPGKKMVAGRRLIDNDESVEHNYQELYYMAMHKFLSEEDDNMSKKELKKEFFGKIQNSINKVFPDLYLNNLADSSPSRSGGGTFFFGKGEVDEYDYKNLSGGEKSVFDLLLDLHMSKEDYGDAIYCIDEVESHVHTSTQGKLVREIINIIPNDAQLWLTTHSLGVLREVQEISKDNPNSVCVLDFDRKDFDHPCTITPSVTKEIASSKFFSVALDGLEEMIIPEFIVVCEGSAYGKRKKDFDKAIYETIFGETYPKVVFVSGGSKSEVERTSEDAKRTIKAIKRSSSNIEIKS